MKKSSFADLYKNNMAFWKWTILKCIDRRTLLLSPFVHTFMAGSGLFHGQSQRCASVAMRPFSANTITFKTSWRFVAWIISFTGVGRDIIFKLRLPSTSAHFFAIKTEIYTNPPDTIGHPCESDESDKFWRHKWDLHTKRIKQMTNRLKRPTEGPALTCVPVSLSRTQLLLKCIAYLHKSSPTNLEVITRSEPLRSSDLTLST